MSNADVISRFLAHVIALMSLFGYIVTVFMGNPQDFTFTMVIAIWMYVMTLESNDKPEPSKTGRPLNYERD